MLRTGERKTEWMKLETMLLMLDEYENDWDYQVLDIERLELPFAGGCYNKGGFKGTTEIDEIVYDWISVKTKEGDCIFANIIKSSEYKGKFIKNIRKELDIKNGDIFIEDIEKIAKYFDCKIIIY